MKLGLGTVQWGTAYGIANKAGQTPESEIPILLADAANAGVRTLDTAPSYGTSEAALGRQLPSPNEFRLVTKTIPIPGDTITDASAAAVADAFHRSLATLRQTSVDALLVHHGSELLRPGAERLVGVLENLKKQKLVKKIGVSIYTAAEIDRALELFSPDVVQIPASLVDQRLLRSGHVAALKRRGVEIHVRSLFLQGLLLQDSREWPPAFEPLRRHWESAMAIARRAGVSALEAALGFGIGRTEFDILLVGVCSSTELRQIWTAYAAAASRPFDADAFAFDDERLLNPSHWSTAK